MARISQYQVVIPGQLIASALWNGMELNIINNGLIPEGIEDYSDTTEQAALTIDPFPSGVLVRATHLGEELAQLRYMIESITGKEDWYRDPDTTISTLATDLATEDGRIDDLITGLNVDGVYPGPDAENPRYVWTGLQGTTASRPANPSTGQNYFNVENGRMEFWNGSAWAVRNFTNNVSGIVQNQINDGAVTESKIGDGAVTGAKIADSAVSELKIGAGQVTTSRIGDSQISTPKIINSAVTSEKIAPSAVTDSKISDLNVTTAKLADLAVTNGKIADNTIEAGKLSVSLKPFGMKLASATITGSGSGGAFLDVLNLSNAATLTGVQLNKIHANSTDDFTLRITIDGTVYDVGPLTSSAAAASNRSIIGADQATPSLASGIFSSNTSQSSRFALYVPCKTSLRVQLKADSLNDGGNGFAVYVTYADGN